MASFERERSISESSMDPGYQKYTFKQVQPSVIRFIKSLDTNLDRLKGHRANIEKFLASEDWRGLHTEQVNSSRTVQQINATIREMERTRNKIVDEDVDKFDEKISEVKLLAVKSVVDFMDCCGKNGSHAPVVQGGRDVVLTRSESDTDVVDGTANQLQLSHPLQAHPIPDNTEAAESWEELKDSLIELNSLIHEFSTMVNDQQEKVDNIEDNVNKAHESVKVGVLQLTKAGKLKAVLLPVAGAIVGGVVAGPFGLLAGIKIGSMAAVGGSIIGLAGGKYFKDRQDKVQETEMNNLSQKTLADAADKDGS